MTLKGKGMWIWKIPSCEGGVAATIASVAKSAGFSHVLIKIANDTRVYNVDSSGNDLVGPVVTALRAKGIQVWGWHYVYGYDPYGEAKVAIAQTKKYSLDGYVIDAEVEYKYAGREAVARTFMTQLRNGLPSMPVGLSSFRWPTYHPTFPWTAFLEKCDVNMPQVYWMQAHNPIYDLKRSVSEFKAITPFRPIVPTGPAFSEGGWTPTASDLNDFLVTAKSTLGLTGANFFSWDECRTKLPTLWSKIVNFSWPATATTDTSSTLPVKILDAMTNRNYDAFLTIYGTNAVLVTAKETIQGILKIQTYYGALLTNKLTGGVFKIGTVEVSDNTIHYTWTCKATRGIVTDGSDTLGIEDGKVSYHYSHYTLT